MAYRVLPSSPSRDAGDDTNVFKGFAEPVRVVSFVCQEQFRGRQGLEQCQSALRIGDVDMKEADRVSLEPLPLWLVALDVRQARDAIPLQASM